MNQLADDFCIVRTVYWLTMNKTKWGGPQAHSCRIHGTSRRRQATLARTFSIARRSIFECYSPIIKTKRNAPDLSIYSLLIGK